MNPTILIISIVLFGNTLPEKRSNFRVLKHRKRQFENLQTHFFTKGYFEKNNKDTFYPFITVVFEIKEHTHYHVPITLYAYGYSTYRGN